MPGKVRAIGNALGAHFDYSLRWQGGDLDRLLNARHAAMHDVVARLLPVHGWQPAPEVSFAIWGERGIIDILAWHEPTRTVLVIELKTEIVDVSEMLGTLDRKRRLATQIAAERGWVARFIGTWLLVADGATNRRRVADHSAVFRASLPDDGRRLRAWLKHPSGPVNALSFLANGHQVTTKRSLATVKRVGSRSRSGMRPENKAKRSPGASLRKSAGQDSR